jgi:hypothetical protein
MPCSVFVAAAAPSKAQRHLPFRHNSSSGVTSVLCLVEKAGSTAWEALLAHDHELPPVQLAGSVAAATPPVLTIVRNPYVRFLSAYLDKAAPHKRGINFNGTFAQFAVHLASCEPQQDSCPSRDVHFAPQLRLCHLSAGFRYDLVLRIEEMPIWYEAVIDLMGLRVAAQSYGKDKDPTACFFHPLNVRCDELFRTGEPRSYSNASVSHADSHATYASEKVLDEYTPLAARAATTLYRADVLQFGYRLWDGIGPLELVPPAVLPLQTSLPPLERQPEALPASLDVEPQSVINGSMPDGSSDDQFARRVTALALWSRYACTGPDYMAQLRPQSIQVKQAMLTGGLSAAVLAGSVGRLLMYGHSMPMRMLIHNVVFLERTSTSRVRAMPEACSREWPFQDYPTDCGDDLSAEVWSDWQLLDGRAFRAMDGGVGLVELRPGLEILFVANAFRFQNANFGLEQLKALLRANPVNAAIFQEPHPNAFFSAQCCGCSARALCSCESPPLARTEIAAALAQQGVRQIINIHGNLDPLLPDSEQAIMRAQPASESCHAPCCSDRITAGCAAVLNISGVFHSHPTHMCVPGVYDDVAAAIAMWASRQLPKQRQAPTDQHLICTEKTVAAETWLDHYKEKMDG